MLLSYEFCDKISGVTRLVYYSFRGLHKGLCASRFRRHVIPMGRRLAAVIDLIDFSARLKRNNHHPCLPKLVTTMVDVLPLKVSDPV